MQKEFMSKHQSITGLLTIVLTTVVLVGTAPADTISGVEVQGASYVSADVVKNTVKDILKPGTEMTPQLAKKAKKEVMKLGYYDRVTIDQKSVGEQQVKVIIKVVETQRIEQILFVGNTALSSQELLKAINARPGGLADPALIERDAARIEEAYTKAGYFARVTSAAIDDFGVLKIVIEEAHIEDIKITGLEKTEQWVVRRQIDIEPGELYRQRRLKENATRIEALRIFESVNIDAQMGQRDPSAITAEFKIKEGRTGQAEAALAYNNLDELVLMLSVRENNFRGEAERASASLELFGRTSYDISYTDPFLDNRDTSLHLELFDTKRSRQFVPGASLSTPGDEFEERRTGGKIRLSRPLDETGRRRFSVGLRNEEVQSSYYQGVKYIGEKRPESAGTAQQLDEVRGGDPGDVVDNPQLLPDVREPGDMLGPVIVAAPLHPGGKLGSITLGYSEDLRDARFQTSRGSFLTLDGEFAGSFAGGDINFQKISGDYRRYYPVGDGENKDVVALRLRYGTSFGSVPLFEAYDVGGSRSLRGYQQDRFRGEEMLVGTAEYRHRINESLGVIGFVDVGDAYSGKFPTRIPGFNVPAEDQSFEPHFGIGVGLRVKTPMGPLGIDIGWGEEGSETHIQVGQSF